MNQSTPPEILCQADGLSYIRGYRPIFKNLCFTLITNNCLILRGSNGSGKTTLLHILTSLLAPSKGQLTLNCEPYYLGHKNALHPNWLGKDILHNMSGFHNTKNKLDKCINALRLEKLLDQPLYRLSAGQQRRIALGQVYLSGRRLWLLDEPTTNLDTITSQQFWALVDEHCQSEGAALIATHESAGLTLPHEELVMHG